MQLFPRLRSVVWTGRPRKHLLQAAVSDLSLLDWGTYHGSAEAMQILMPGEWDSLVTAQVACCSMYIAHEPQQHAPVKYSVLVSELNTLLSVVDFSMSPSVVDMCAGQGELSSALRALDFSVVSNSVTPGAGVDYHFDAMQPNSYQRLRSEYGAHVIVVTPLLELTDAILSLAVIYAQHFACCRVPCRYLNERRLYPARDAWLQRLQDGGRLLLLYPAGGGDGNVWLVVFKSAELRKLLAPLG